MASGIWTLDGQALTLYKDLMDGCKMEIEERLRFHVTLAFI